MNEPVLVYNFEVEDWHTYFVSDIGVLVHNSCSMPPQKGIGGKGWRGDMTWKTNIEMVKTGGTITDFRGQIPTMQEAIDLIKESGGRVDRIEGPHFGSNPHSYNHINYTTSNGKKGTIKIQ